MLNVEPSISSPISTTHRLKRRCRFSTNLRSKEQNQVDSLGFDPIILHGIPAGSFHLYLRIFWYSQVQSDLRQIRTAPKDLAIQVRISTQHLALRHFANPHGRKSSRVFQAIPIADLSPNRPFRSGSCGEFESWKSIENMILLF